MAVPFQDGLSQFFDDSGNPLAGGLVYTYAAGTTTPVATYTTRAGSVELSNPVVLDSAGRASIWVDRSQAYRFDLKSADDVLISSVDNIRCTDGTSAAFLEETYTATAGQTVFVTATEYVPGISATAVYVGDGGALRLWVDEDYTETDGNTITLLDGVDEGTPVYISFTQPLTNFGTEAAAVSYSPRFGQATSVQSHLRILDELQAIVDADRADPTRNGLISGSVQFRGATDAADTLGTLGLIVNSDTNTAASARFALSDADYVSTINGASDVGRVLFIGPFDSAVLRVHIAQLGLTAPYTVVSSGEVSAATPGMLRLDFASDEDVRIIEWRESAPTDYAGTPGTGSARMVTVLGIKEVEPA